MAGFEPATVGLRSNSRLRHRRNRNAVVTATQAPILPVPSALFGLNDFDLVFLFGFVGAFLFCKPNLAVHIFGADDPGNLFHIRLAWNPLVVVVGAVAHFERNQPRGTEKRAQNRLFTLRKAALNMRPVARVA